MYQYLNFFNKKGEYCNFTYDSTNDKWIGRVDFGSVSTGIAEDFQIYIMEELQNSNTSFYELGYPITEWTLFSPSNADANKVNAYFDPKNPVEDLFIYNFDLSTNTNLLNKVYNMEYLFEYDQNQTIAPNNTPRPEIKITSNFQAKALQINLGFMPSDENGYSSILYLKDSVGHIFAEILLYGEGIEEDERLRDLLVNMGQDLLPSDIKIFDNTDINESEVDWEFLNYKRKELLLEYSNIFPYIGTYKALINIIKFFGYQNLRMKEYWLNVDSSSVYYGKYKQIDIADVFDENANYVTSGLVPSKIYKKTSKFGLFYDITVTNGQFDDDGLPVVEEVFSFSPEEVLIKIFALKKKLQNYFLPVNARIVDIIGEAIYFSRYDTNIWNDQYRIDDIKLGLKPKFTVLPSREGYIEDLRPMYHYGCPVGSDLTIGGQTNLLSWRIVLNPGDVYVGDLYLDRVQEYKQFVEVPIGATTYTIDTVIKKDPNTGQVTYKNWEVANKIIENWLSIPYIKENFNVYQEGGFSGAIRIVQKNPIGDGDIYCDWSSDTNPGPATSAQYTSPLGAGHIYSINVSPGGSFGPSGAPMSYFADCFLGYFDKTNVSVFNLNDDEDIPVGYPIVLRNDTFNISWDDADTNFNQIDRNDPITNSRLYANYNFSTDPGFPNTNPNYPNQDTYSWINLGYYGYYQMQWIVTKEADDMPAFRYDTGQKPINEINSLPLILPYEGIYKVELYMWDGYNNMSFLINEDWITVSMYDSDFTGWYQKRELEYNINTDRYEVQRDISVPVGVENRHPNPDLTWDEYASVWDLPLHPNESVSMADISYHSLDSIEFYQSMINPSDNPLIDRYPYTFNLLTELATWDDLYHLWWDGIGSKITQWEINELSNVGYAYVFMTRANSLIDFDNVNAYYYPFPFNGDPEYAPYFVNGTNIGDVLVSSPYYFGGQVIRVYLWDGIGWKRSNELVDVFAVPLYGGTTVSKFERMVEYLNFTMNNDYRNHPFFNDFIYYLDYEYRFASNTNPTYGLYPYIRAVSKDIERPERHKIKIKIVNELNQPLPDKNIKSYATVNLGYLGDIPTSFEIYSMGSGSNRGIKISGMTAFYPVSPSTTNLVSLYNELNGPTAQSYSGIKDFTYNIVYGYSGFNGNNQVSPTPIKIIATSKRFTSNEPVTISYNTLRGTTYARSLIKNPTYNEIRILKYTQELPLCTVVNFTYDGSRVRGKKNPIWKLIKEGDPDFDDIYYNNKYFSYMFTERGSYTLSLQVEDTNGNKQTIEKKEIIKIV